ncbi:MAG: DUF1295 domain-containing protein [Planctomycetes bacterium]|nr:DUF1295 domain-containing protein [Planctomycetota bacterium]
MKSDALSLLAFVAAVAGLLGLLFSEHLFARTPLWIAVQVLAVALMLWARVTFGLRSFHAGASAQAGGLVTTGPYRYWRHPIYASLLYLTWAGQVHAPTAGSLALATLVTAALVTRMLLEERSLRALYPEYDEMMGRAKRFVPFVA